MNLLFNILKSMIYGIVQGITEWLPISSSGHLILMNSFMPLNVFTDPAMNVSFWDMYKVVIQLGSIIAVLVVYIRFLNPFQEKISAVRKRNIWRLWIMIIIASIPTAIAGLLLDDWIDEKMNSTYVIGFMLILYGIFFILIERFEMKDNVKRTGQITAKHAFLTGLCQCLALIPGTSRSGATIIGERLMGFTRTLAVEFSFFLAIPTMLGASLLKVIKMGIPMNFSAILVLLVGMLTAFVVSVFVIRKVIEYIQTHDFKLFGYYRIVLGVIVILFTLLKLI